MGAPQTAPAPLFGASDKVRAQRVRFDVAADSEEMGVVLPATGTKDYQTPDGVRVAPALRLLAGLV